jgi:hypothetical protein
MTKKTSPRDIPANPNRRRLLAMCLPVAAVLPWFSTPLTAALTRIWKGVFDGRFAPTTVSVLPLETEALEDFVTRSARPFYLRGEASAVRWLVEQIQQHVAPKEWERVLAAAMREDALYPFFWVCPGHVPDFATVFHFLETGEIPEHRRGLGRWGCGIIPDTKFSAPSELKRGRTDVERDLQGVG